MPGTSRRDFLRHLSVGATSALLAPTALAAPRAPVVTVSQTASDHFTLAFAPRGPRPLRILQITDTHFGSPTEKNRQLDLRSYQTITRLVLETEPDLLVHTGDFVNNDQGSQVRWDAVDFLDSLGLPWTHTLGNHDIGARPIDDFHRDVRRGLLGHFDADGQTHHAFRIDVVAPDSTQPLHTLFCFDSGSRAGSKHVSSPQLAWFQRQLAADTERQAPCPATAWIHIPVREFDTLYSSRAFRGLFGERVSYESDSGQTFAACDASQRVQAIFSGHDHFNDFCGKHGNVELVYGRVSGWSGYGDLQRGGRLIEIDLQAQTCTHRLVVPRDDPATTI